MSRGIVVVVVTVGAVLLSAQPASAGPTCDDYDNQAEAQRAADTRDADGDGIYCETLPCPCLKPGQGGGGGGGGSEPTPRRSKPKKRAQVIAARITDVIDGDTVEVRAYGAKRKFYDVRLIGIDTPETKKPGVAVECGGPEATSLMFDLAFTDPLDTDDDGLFDEPGGDGLRVTLRTDPTQDLFDGFDRLLAYVSRAGALFQTRMLSAGWATTYVFEKPFRKVKRFRAAERRARNADRGVYGMCGGDFHSEQ